MLVGVKKNFAIESEISKAYQCLNFRALGFFVIYIDGFCFGRREADATMLACSYETVYKRLQNQGKHISCFLSDIPAVEISLAVQDACYAEYRRMQTYFGLTADEFLANLRKKNIWWTPDGDEAFDDGSNILHFDEGEQVRIIGFINEEKQDVLSRTVKEIIINKSVFYSYLAQWLENFDMQWKSLPKEPI